MDHQARQLERQAQASGDLNSQVRYLRSQLRYKPGMRDRIGFAAYMGHEASLQIYPVEKSKLFNLNLPNSWHLNPRSWHLWKHFCRTLGKQPVVAALLACIERDSMWQGEAHKEAKEDAKKELLGHYRKKLQDKSYRAKYLDPALKDVGSRWRWDVGFAPIFNRIEEDRLRDYMHVIGGSRRYTSQGSSIVRTVGRDSEIKQACIEWALHDRY